MTGPRIRLADDSEPVDVHLPPRTVHPWQCYCQHCGEDLAEAHESIRWVNSLPYCSERCRGTAWGEPCDDIDPTGTRG